MVALWTIGSQTRQVKLSSAAAGVHLIWRTKVAKKTCPAEVEEEKGCLRGSISLEVEGLTNQWDSPFLGSGVHHWITFLRNETPCVQLLQANQSCIRRGSQSDAVSRDIKHQGERKSERFQRLERLEALKGACKHFFFLRGRCKWLWTTDGFFFKESFRPTHFIQSTSSGLQDEQVTVAQQEETSSEEVRLPEHGCFFFFLMGKDRCFGGLACFFFFLCL